MPCYSPLKGWKDEETGGIVFRKSREDQATFEVACGSCLGCRLDRSRMWAMRIVHESSLHEDSYGNCFVTLTYRSKAEATEEQKRDQFYIPDNWSLDKAHFRDFMKRLRHHFKDRKIRFFHCGEYGNTCRHNFDLRFWACPYCSLGRPHYHACLFNIHFDDMEPYQTDRGEVRFTSPLLESIWKWGFVDVGELNFESAAYVARYILKKVDGKKAKEHYMYVDDDGVITFLEPEYCTMSRRPGIGKDWFDRYQDDCFPSDEVPVPGRGVFKKVPRYYEELFKHKDAMTHEEIKAMRQRFREEHGDEYTPERLMQKYKVKKAQVGQLKRSV